MPLSPRPPRAKCRTFNRETRAKSVPCVGPLVARWGSGSHTHKTLTTTQLSHNSHQDPTPHTILKIRYFPRYYVTCRGGASTEKKNTRKSHSPRAPSCAPRSNAHRPSASTSRCRCWRSSTCAALTGSACAHRNWHGARATRSVYGWLRSHVVEAAGARSS